MHFDASSGFRFQPIRTNWVLGCGHFSLIRKERSSPAAPKEAARKSAGQRRCGGALPAPPPAAHAVTLPARHHSRASGRARHGAWRRVRAPGRWGDTGGGGAPLLLARADVPALAGCAARALLPVRPRAGGRGKQGGGDLNKGRREIALAATRSEKGAEERRSGAGADGEERARTRREG